MKLSQLNEILQAFKQNRSWLEVVLAPLRSSQLQQHLEKLVLKYQVSHQQEVSLHDKFYLASVIDFNSDEFLHKKIRNLFDSKLFYALFPIFQQVIGYDNKAFEAFLFLTRKTNPHAALFARYFIMASKLQVLTADVILAFDPDPKKISLIETIGQHILNIPDDLVNMQVISFTAQLFFNQQLSEFNQFFKIIKGCVAEDQVFLYARSLMELDASQIATKLVILKKLKKITVLNQNILDFVIEDAGRQFDSVLSIYNKLGYQDHYGLILSEIMRFDSRIGIDIYILLLNLALVNGYLSREYEQSIRKEYFSLEDEKYFSYKNILSIVLKYQLDFKHDDLKSLECASQSDLQSIHQILRRACRDKFLEKNNMLRVIIERVLSKNVHAEETGVEIKWINQGPNLYSYKLDGKLFFMKKLNRSSWNGAFGSVYVLSDSRLDHGGFFAYKKIQKRESGLEKKYAEREVKYNRLLGRQAWFFKDQASYSVIMDWQSGKLLSDISQFDLNRCSYNGRLKCLIDVFGQLNQLHERFRVHEDIKLDNLIIDLDAHTLKLIDFNGAHKTGRNKKSIVTALFAKNGGNDFGLDMHLMSFVVAKLFPEVFHYSDKLRPVFIRYIGAFNAKPAVRAVHALYMTLSQFYDVSQCTARDAMQYCELVMHESVLTQERLSIIQSQTIHRERHTLEDYLCKVASYDLQSESISTLLRK